VSEERNERTVYDVRTYSDGYLIYELSEPSTASKVLLCPERGGIMLGCQLHGRELLYLDRDTFLDPAANIRGGNPVLFPICGQLPELTYAWEGRSYRMPNHGIARTNAWEVAAVDSDGQAAVTLVLRSSPATKEAYPFDFELRFTYRLRGGVLAIEQEYRNPGDTAMPMVAGFHPYFRCEPERKRFAFASDATRYYDYNDREVKPFAGSVDLGPLREAVALLDASASSIAFEPADDVRVALAYSPAFRYVYLWSVPGKPFVCVEPWTARSNEMNRQEELLLVEPGETLRLGMEFSIG